MVHKTKQGLYIVLEYPINIDLKQLNNKYYTRDYINKYKTTELKSKLGITLNTLIKCITNNIPINNHYYKLVQLVIVKYLIIDGNKVIHNVYLSIKEAIIDNKVTSIHKAIKEDSLLAGGYYYERVMRCKIHEPYLRDDEPMTYKIKRPNRSKNK